MRLAQSCHQTPNSDWKSSQHFLFYFIYLFSSKTKFSSFPAFLFSFLQFFKCESWSLSNAYSFWLHEVFYCSFHFIQSDPETLQHRLDPDRGAARCEGGTFSRCSIVFIFYYLFGAFPSCSSLSQFKTFRHDK